MTTRIRNFLPLPQALARPVCWFGAAMLAWAGSSARAQGNSDWTQHLRLGLPVTVNVKARFMENGVFPIAPSAAGQYNDGYVLPDQTGDIFNQTGNWGYHGSDQYNSTANTLTMHSATSYTANGSASKDLQSFLGVEAAYGTDLWKLGSARIGWEFGAGLTPLHATDSESLTSSVNQNAFVFSTAAIDPVLMPPAGYNGNPSGSGGEPTIPDTPSSTYSTNTTGSITGSRKLDLMLYTLRLGPTASWDVCSRFSLMAGAGPAVGILNGNYNYSENVVTATGTAESSGRIKMTRTVYGGYVNAQAICHVISHADLYLGAQFMPLSSATVSGAGREAKVDLSSALQFSLGFNWPF